MCAVLIIYPATVWHHQQGPVLRSDLRCKTLAMLILASVQFGFISGCRRKPAMISI